jgi:hypothetical protein
VHQIGDMWPPALINATGDADVAVPTAGTSGTGGIG